MHTFIIIVSNEPALGINEPINQPRSRTINEHSSESNRVCLFVILCSPNPPSPETHPVSSEAIDQLLRAKVSLSFSLASPWTKPGSVWEITAQDATWKPLYLCENKRLPAVLLPSQATSPSFTYPAPSTCGSLFKAPHQGQRRPQTGAENMKAWEKESTLLLSSSVDPSVSHHTEGKEKQHLSSDT